MVLKQAENCIYMDSKKEMEAFENFPIYRFDVGEKLRKNDKVHGTTMSKDAQEIITICQQDQLEQVTQYPIRVACAVLNDEMAT